MSIRVIDLNTMQLIHSDSRQGSVNDLSLKAGMPGKIIQIFAKPGEVIKANKPLLIMEAMKMENEMRTTAEVKIKEICVKQGDNVESGAVLIKFEKP